MRDVDVRDRAMLYYRLLHHDVNQALRVVNGGPRIPITCSTGSQHQVAVGSLLMGIVFP